MIVWVLRENYSNRIIGVFTEAGKKVKEEELLQEALRRREQRIKRLTEEVAEQRAIRAPFITEAAELLEVEKAAKEANDTATLITVKKQRKVALKQTSLITSSIQRKEDEILRYQRMMWSEIRSEFGTKDYDWEDHYLEGTEYQVSTVD